MFKHIKRLTERVSTLNVVEVIRIEKKAEHKKYEEMFRNNIFEWWKQFEKDLSEYLKKSVHAKGPKQKDTHYSEQSVDKVLKEFDVYLLLVNNEPAGYSTVFRESLYFEKTCDINELFITKEHRGNHYSIFLIKEIFKEQKKLGAQYCAIAFLSANTTAANLYAKYGFIPYSHVNIAKL